MINTHKLTIDYQHTVISYLQQHIETLDSKMKDMNSKMKDMNIRLNKIETKKDIKQKSQIKVNINIFCHFDTTHIKE